MKRLLLSILIAGLAPFVVNAQDIITKKDGTDIEANVKEVASTYVKYVKANNPNGPTYTLDTSEILLIRFENGEKEVFGNTQPKSSYATSSNVANKPNVPYKVLKSQYDYSAYQPTINDKYSPGWMGVASFFIPGLGQGICNEWGRALGFFLGNMVLQTTGYVLNMGEAYVPALICYSAALGVDIWCIVDAVRVAKVKNMYFNDENYSSLNIKLEPAIAFVPTCNNNALPTYGLSLKLSF